MHSILDFNFLSYSRKIHVFLQGAAVSELGVLYIRSLKEVFI